MLNREQRLALLRARRTPGCLFSKLPKELIHIISTSAQDKTKFNTALQAVGFGDLNSLRRFLKKAREDKVLLKEHLFNRGQMTTRAGVIVKHTTLLEAAILGLDPEMAAVIIPYFYEVDGCEEELKRQLTRCRPCIDAMITMTQKPWEPTKELVVALDAVKAAPAQDVSQELNTGKQYNEIYESPLRHALKQWRQAKLAPDKRVIDVLRAPRIHCNPSNWMHVHVFLDDEWRKNEWKDFMVNGDNYDKIHLILRQLRGLEELAEFTACLRFAFANDEVEYPRAQITRSVNHEYDNGSFPDFDSSSIERHSGLAFDFYVSMFGAGTRRECHRHLCGICTDLFTKLISDNCFALTELMRRPEQRPAPTTGSCVII